MNDVTPPRLPTPPPRPKVNMRGVKPVDPPVPIPQAEPQVEAPLSLPSALPGQHMRFGKPRKKRWLMWLLISVALLLVLLAGGAYAAYSWYNNALQPRSASSDRVKIVVASGETADQVATDLQQKSVIKSALALQVYVKLNGKGSIKAGSYLFAPNQTPSEIIAWLQEGRVDTFKITILPGQTLADIKQALIKSGFAAADIDTAFGKTYTSPLFDDKPANTTLEGYIYPDTYYASSDTTVEQLLQLSFDEFEKQIDQNNLRTSLKQQNFTLYQGITLASIIEKEVGSQSDQRQVAQVFEKRLQIGMMLGSDVTYHYAAGLLGVAPSPDIDSPYNTRKYTGLPPGPIANFNLQALQAVANPATGDYLYFVAGDDGTTHFANTLDEHNANVQQYCQKLCASN